MIKINKNNIEQIVVDEYVSAALSLLFNVDCDGYMEGLIRKGNGKLFFQRRYGKVNNSLVNQKIINEWIEFINIGDRDYLYVNKYGNGVSFEIINDVFCVMGED